MIRDSPEELLAIIRSFVPDTRKSLPAVRREFSEFYKEFQGDAAGPARVGRFEIGQGVTGFWITIPESVTDRVMLFFHSGDFSLGSTDDHLGLCVRIARAAKASVFSVDYRLAPENPFPAAVEDAVAGYQFLIARGIGSHRIIPVGMSTGATLVLDLLLTLRDEGMSLPPAAVCLSPDVDMVSAGDSVTRNKDRDWITPGRLAAIRANYIAGGDPTGPLASPLNARLNGLPRLYIQAGTYEILIDSIVAFVEKTRWAGVPVQFDLWEGMFHCWQVFAEQIPEGQEAIDRIGTFVQNV